MRLSVAEKFSVTPGPRRRVEGKYSGEEFRETRLRDAVREAIARREILVVVLDGTAGYGTSFLEEAFGGLIRNDGIPLSDLHKWVRLESTEEPDLLREVEEYMLEAEQKKVR